MKRSCRFGGSNGVGVLEQLEQLEEEDKGPFLEAAPSTNRFLTVVEKSERRLRSTLETPANLLTSLRTALLTDPAQFCPSNTGDSGLPTPETPD
jgi:hypothetical protein